MNLSQVFRYVDRKLETKPGLNRFHWNLEQKGAWDKNTTRSFKGGPMVAPGMYTVKLTIEGNSFEQHFEIKIDPRVKEEGVSEANISTQIEMQQKVIDLLSEARKYEAELEKQAEKLKNNSPQKLEEITKNLKLLSNESGAYPQQMLLSQISYLLNMISDADQLPGEEAQKRYQELSIQFQNLKQGK